MGRGLIAAAEDAPTRDRRNSTPTATATTVVGVSEVRSNETAALPRHDDDDEDESGHDDEEEGHDLPREAALLNEYAPAVCDAAQLAAVTSFLQEAGTFPSRPLQRPATDRSTSTSITSEDDDDDDDIEGDDSEDEEEVSLAIDVFRSERKWMAPYNRLLQFCKNRDKFPTRRILNNVCTDFQLGQWVDRQRRAYNRQTRYIVTDKRVALLEKVRGWKWTTRKPPKAKALAVLCDVRSFYFLSLRFVSFHFAIAISVCCDTLVCHPILPPTNDMCCMRSVSSLSLFIRYKRKSRAHACICNNNSSDNSSDNSRNACSYNVECGNNSSSSSNSNSNSNSNNIVTITTLLRLRLFVSLRRIVLQIHSPQQHLFSDRYHQCNYSRPPPLRLLLCRSILPCYPWPLLLR